MMLTSGPVMTSPLFGQEFIRSDVYRNVYTGAFLNTPASIELRVWMNNYIDLNYEIQSFIHVINYLSIQTVVLCVELQSLSVGLH